MEQGGAIDGFTSIMEQKTTPGGKVEQGGATVGVTEEMARFQRYYGSVLGPEISPGPVWGGIDTIFCTESDGTILGAESLARSPYLRGRLFGSFH